MDLSEVVGGDAHSQLLAHLLDPDSPGELDGGVTQFPADLFGLVSFSFHLVHRCLSCTSELSSHVDQFLGSIPLTIGPLKTA
jgi:hypothetical protein